VISRPPRPPIPGTLLNPEAAKAAFPFQVRIAHPRETGWRLWSHHKKLDGNLRRSMREARRDFPDAAVIIFDTSTNTEINEA
jgi:hypothetical protein